SVAKARSDLLEHFVAARVTDVLVDRLERVDVDAENGVAVPRARRATVLALELLDEATLVRQLRERVDGDDRFEPLQQLLRAALGGSLTRDVARDAEPTDAMVLVVVHRHRAPARDAHARPLELDLGALIVSFGANDLQEDVGLFARGGEKLQHVALG